MKDQRWADHAWEGASGAQASLLLPHHPQHGLLSCGFRVATGAPTIMSGREEREEGHDPLFNGDKRAHLKGLSSKSQTTLPSVFHRPGRITLESVSSLPLSEKTCVCV